MDENRTFARTTEAGAVEFINADGVVMLRFLPNGDVQLEDGSISPNDKLSQLGFLAWIRATRGAR